MFKILFDLSFNLKLKNYYFVSLKFFVQLCCVIHMLHPYKKVLYFSLFIKLLGEINSSNMDESRSYVRYCIATMS